MKAALAVAAAAREGLLKISRRRDGRWSELLKFVEADRLRFLSRSTAKRMNATCLLSLTLTFDRRDLSDEFQIR